MAESTASKVATKAVVVTLGGKTIELDAKTFASGNTGYQAMGDIAVGGEVYRLNFMLVKAGKATTRKSW